MPLTYKTQKQRIIKVILEITLILGLGLGYYLFVRIVGRGLPCFFHEITGLYCPGCGASRMCMALLRFDFKTAFYYNPALLVTAPVLAVLYILNKIRYIKTGKNISSKIEDILLIAVLVILILFCIYRNIFLPPI